MSDRELTMDDYLAMLRRRLKVILIPALVAPLAGFLASYALTPRYTSTATVLVEGQKVPDAYVDPIITADFAQRVQQLQERVLTTDMLTAMLAGGTVKIGLDNVQMPGIEKNNPTLFKPADRNKIISQIQQNTQVAPVITSMSAAVSNSPTAKKKPSASNEPVPGFSISYLDSDGVRAQKICDALAQLMVDANLHSRSDIAASTTKFLSDQLTAAKENVDNSEKAFADFKQKNMGQLPIDVENNVRSIQTMTSQLDAATQTLSRAQQDKTYAESMLAQQLAVWRSSLSTTNPQTLQQELTQLQGQLLQLQARYTDDYPDVIKTKKDIADVEKKLKEANAAAAAAMASDSSTAAITGANAEPPEIRALRLQIHLYKEQIQQNTLEQKKLQSAINVAESRTNMSPAIEEQYNALKRDADNAQSVYQGLLVKENSANLGTKMENNQEGEQMHIAGSANLPNDPSFPVRPLLAAGGFGAGLAFGALIAIFLEFSDKSIRTGADAAAVTDLPLLISVPWLLEDEDKAGTNGNGRRRFWGRGDPKDKEKDHERVEV
jgi:uncharacterized protein involved in exopolysaccharide biosynthesis